MRDYRSIFNIIGILLCIEAIAMLIPLFVDLVYFNDDWKQFFYSSIITFFIGLVLFFSFKTEEVKIDVRQAFVLTILSWFLIAIFGSIPFIYTDTSLGFTDSFFESVSGITTTGATVIDDLDSLPEGIII